MSNQVPELLPCPFCGGPAISRERGHQVLAAGVFCQRGTQGLCDMGMTRFSFEKWNTRSDIASAEVERVREAATNVLEDAQGKIGLVPGNTAFENGRIKAATEIITALETAEEPLQTKPS